MATKNRKRKPRAKTMSQGVSKRVKRGRSKRRSASRSSKMGLSEAFNPASATHTGKSMLKSAVVGYGMRSVEPLLDTMSKPLQHGVILGASFIAGTVLKMDSISNSIATIWGYKLANDMQGMNDDGDWANEDSMDEDAEYMDEAGNPMYLADDGQFYYLDEGDDDDDDSMDEDEMMGEVQYLASNGIPYPGYANVSDY